MHIIVSSNFIEGSQNQSVILAQSALKLHFKEKFYKQKLIQENSTQSLQEKSNTLWQS